MEGKDIDTRALQGLVNVMSLLHSAVDRDAVLEAVVNGVCDALGYGIAVIRVLEEDESVLRTAAVAGPPAAVAALNGRHLPLAELSKELTWADRYEDVYLVPWERLPNDVISTWVPELPDASRAASPDAWHPMDALYVALNDRNGQLLGVLGVDLPHSGLRPGPRQREFLQTFGHQAAVALERTKMLDQQSQLLASLRLRQEESAALVATLTHDLKAPLTVILGHAELARDKVDEECSTSLPVHIDSITQAVQRMTHTIDELLEQHQLDQEGSSHAARTLEWVDVGGVASEIVTVSRVVADRRGLTLDLNVSGDAATVMGDRRQLLRVMDNLVSNALKYTPAGGRVVLSVDGRAQEVVVNCADDGVGIPEEEQGVVFLDYGRAAQARTAGIEGAGLGLPSAHRTIIAHGGTLTLASTPGVGSVFTARFPRTAQPTSTSLRK